MTQVIVLFVLVLFTSIYINNFLKYQLIFLLFNNYYR